MLLPLIILGLLSIVAGLVPFGHFVSSDGEVLNTELHLGFSIAPVVLGLLGIGLALLFYKKENDKPNRMASALSGFYTGALHKFYIDEIYLFVTRKVIFNLIGRPAAWFDKTVVDGSMNGITSFTTSFSGWIKGIQSGKLQDYTLYFFSGLIGFVLLVIYLWT